MAVKPAGETVIDGKLGTGNNRWNWGMIQQVAWHWEEWSLAVRFEQAPVTERENPPGGGG